MKEPRLEPPDPLAGLVSPPAPPALRQKVLAAAQVALLEAPRPTDAWTRVWESRSARLAWATVLLLLLGGHALVSRPHTVRPATPPPAALASATRSAEAEIAAIGRLPRLDLDARPLRAETEPPAPRRVPPVPVPAKETRS